MDIVKLIAEVKELSKQIGHAELLERVAQLEHRVGQLLQDQVELVARSDRKETDFASRIRAIRHEVAQPLTTIQFFLDLLPAILQQEHLVVSQFTNQNYWTKTYGRALAAVKIVPQILEAGPPASPASPPIPEIQPAAAPSFPALPPRVG